VFVQLSSAFSSSIFKTRKFKNGQIPGHEPSSWSSCGSS